MLYIPSRPETDRTAARAAVLPAAGLKLSATLLTASLIGISAHAAATTGPNRTGVASPAATAKRLPAAKRGARPAPTPKATDDTLSEGQLAAAERVLTGAAECEFRQTISVEAVPGRHGRFNLLFGRNRYVMLPQETTTGAVRLEDRRAGVVWLQIPSKSMLMNTRIGQRLVDDCRHPDQRLVQADNTRPQGIGIVPQAPPAAAATVMASSADAAPSAGAAVVSGTATSVAASAAAPAATEASAAGSGAGNAAVQPSASAATTAAGPAIAQ